MPVEKDKTQSKVFAPSKPSVPIKTYSPDKPPVWLGTNVMGGRPGTPRREEEDIKTAEPAWMGNVTGGAGGGQMRLDSYGRPYIAPSIQTDPRTRFGGEIGDEPGQVGGEKRNPFTYTAPGKETFRTYADLNVYKADRYQAGLPTSSTRAEGRIPTWLGRSMTGLGVRPGDIWNDSGDGSGGGRRGGGRGRGGFGTQYSGWGGSDWGNGYSNLPSWYLNLVNWNIK